MKNELIAVFLSTLALSATAQPISIVQRADATTPYLLEVYPCDISKMSFQGKRNITPIKDGPSVTYLAVTQSTYDQLRVEAGLRWAKHIRADKEIQRTKSKIIQFEESGNIEAMRHWDKKLGTMSREIELKYQQEVTNAFVLRETSKPDMQKYYEAEFGNLTKYLSIEDMKEDVGNYCRYS